jgi:hypothetical protein
MTRAGTRKRSLAISEKAVGPDYLGTVYALEKYTNFLREMQRNEEATQLEERVREIRARRSE